MSEPKDRSRPATARVEKGLVHREEIVRNGLLVVDGQVMRVTADHVVSNPSIAAAMITGGSVNGRTSWKTEGELTLGEWMDRVPHRSSGVVLTTMSGSNGTNGHN
jgi:hypothetical protein